MRRRHLCALMLAWAAEASLAVPFWGDRASMPADTPAASLKPGQFVWSGAAVPEGPMVVVVSLTEQRAYVYRNGVRIGVTTVSTGKRGHETPTGVFTILQKNKDHRSSIYDNAPMPYMQRLTWGGVALHAGGLPGYPESHGCVHLPSEFARLLFETSSMGMTVVVAREGQAPRDIAHPKVLAPVAADSGQALASDELAEGQAFRWTPELATEGPVTILLTAGDGRVIVYRNGVEIGRARVELRDPSQPLGTHVFVVAAGSPSGESGPRWIGVGIPGYADAAGKPLDPAEADRVRMPPAFRSAVAPLLVPGTTLMVTDAAVFGQTTGVSLKVLDDGDEDEPAAPSR